METATTTNYNNNSHHQNGGGNIVNDSSSVDSTTTTATTTAATTTTNPDGKSSSSSSSHHHKKHKKEKHKKKHKHHDKDKDRSSSSHHRSSSSSNHHKSSSSSSKDKDKDKKESSSKSSSSSHNNKHSSSSSKSSSSKNNGEITSSTTMNSSSSSKPLGPPSAPPPIKKEYDHDNDDIRKRSSSSRTPSPSKQLHPPTNNNNSMNNNNNNSLNTSGSSNNSSSSRKSPEKKHGGSSSHNNHHHIKHEVSDMEVDGGGGVKEEDDDSEDDVPLSARRSTSSSTNKRSSTIKKEEPESMSEDDVPLISRNSTSKTSKKTASKKRPRADSSDEEEEEYSEDDDSDYGGGRGKNKRKSGGKGAASKRGSSSSSSNKKQKTSSSSSSAKKSSTQKSSTPSSNNSSPRKRVKKEEEQEVWKWWEEERRDDGVKWNFLQHKGPVFAPPYERLPKSVTFRYGGKVVRLSQDAEEIAGFYSRFIEHEYTTKEKFNTNFFKDWRRSMSSEERDLITDLKKCDFREINDYYKMKSEERKAMSKEEKLKIKEENEALIKEYGIAVIDGHKEKIGNFRIEPPGLFRGRGDHPKMGMLKKRIVPEDVIINCSKDSKAPEAPKGRRWKEVRHDNTVTWLACWTENVQGQQKYVMLNPTSRLKGEKDWMKYEKARELAKHIDKIRVNYNGDFKSKEMRIRQRAVAMYFIDKLALRAGNEKDEDQADTVGCCSLRFEHIQLVDRREEDGKENIVIFDFLGKDSIRYYNEVPVEKRVYKNLKIFMDNKKEGDDLFDRLNTAVLNKHLNELLSGLTAKVFRTYNASHTLQQQLDELTPEDGSVAEKVLAYNRANRAVAILCNHQRAAPKTHEKSMENLVNKINSKKEEIKGVKKELKGLRKGTKDFEKKTAQAKRLKEQLQKLEMNRTDKEEGKEIALGTSKLNYLDPRISVAWCKKYDVPIEKVYNKTQRDKFRWAIDMATSEFRFD